MKPTKKRWIITGCNGYLGGEICRTLCHRGEVVIGLARAGRQPEYLAALGVHCHTYSEANTLLAPGDTLVHCAGKVGAMGTWDEFSSINVEWTAALFEQAVARGAGCFVFISSVAALGYGNRSSDEALDETASAQLSVGELYGRSKLQAEQTLLECARGSSTRLIILRPGLVYGRRPQTHRQTWLRRGFAFDRNQRVPLVHINSLIDAIVRVVAHPEAEGVFFVVDDEQPTLRELNALKVRLGILRYPPWHVGRVGFWMLFAAQSAVRVLRGTGGSVPKGFARAHYSFHTRRLRYSTQRLRAVTGWAPAVSLVDGLNECRHTIQSTPPSAGAGVHA